MPDRSRRLQLLAMKLATLARDHGADRRPCRARRVRRRRRAARRDAGVGAGRRRARPRARTGAGLGDPPRGRRPAARRRVRHRGRSPGGRRRSSCPSRCGTPTAERCCRPSPSRCPNDRRLPAEHEAFRELIVAAGATPVVEHGVLIGEVGGLEVCRAVTDADTGAYRLEVGIGAHDREAFQLLHGDEPTATALTQFVASVAPHRAPGAVGHPLNRLARSRALRSRLEAEPDADRRVPRRGRRSTARPRQRQGRRALRRRRATSTGRRPRWCAAPASTSTPCPTPSTPAPRPAPSRAWWPSPPGRTCRSSTSSPPSCAPRAGRRRPAVVGAARRSLIGRCSSGWQTWRTSSSRWRRASPTPRSSTTSGRCATSPAATRTSPRSSRRSAGASSCSTTPARRASCSTTPTATSARCGERS